MLANFILLCAVLVGDTTDGKQIRRGRPFYTCRELQSVSTVPAPSYLEAGQRQRHWHYAVDHIRISNLNFAIRASSSSTALIADSHGCPRQWPSIFDTAQRDFTAAELVEGTTLQIIIGDDSTGYSARTREM